MILGIVLYFSSKEELNDLFSSYFDIIDLRTIEISGKSVSYIVNYAFMEKKSGKLNTNMNKQ